MADTGLLISMLETGTQKAILDDDLYINEGGLLENVCGSEIANKYDKLMYFERKSKLEMDFILNIDGKVTAIEIKSGNNKQAKSLDSIIKNYKTVTRYIKFEKDTNIYIDDKKIEHYPLFMIMFI
jgi:predicted AAA+ superfamily ATPase